MPTLPSMAAEVAFISGVNSDGTLPLDAFAAWNPGTIPADYSGGYTNSAKWGGTSAGATAGTAGGTVYYYFTPSSNWTATEQSCFAAGLAMWSAICNISFVQTTIAGQAEITFTRGSNSSAQTSQSLTGSGTAGETGSSVLLTMTSATISIDTGVAGFGPINGSFTQYGGYAWETLLHEEGHAIGLGHAGPYNNTVNPATQQFSPYDTRLWSIMSYINPTTTTAAYYNQYPVTGTRWSSEYATTWMSLDILAAQALYGLPTSTPLSGGQTFGFNCNVTGAIEQFFDFNINATPVITIWDMGTDNTLDLSGWSTSSNVNLNPGTFSSCDGLTNNLCIAFNTAIDTLKLGSGNSTVLCNNDGDTIYARAGNDTLTGGTGNDTFYAGTGNDMLDGGTGLNKAVYSGNFSAFTIAHNADGSVTVSGPEGTDSLTHIEKLVFADQTVAIGTAPRSDFNADGSSDILWQNDSGQAAVWYMNGTSIQSGSGFVGNDPGPTWHIIGSGDFNGDGNADILWQNDNSQSAVWFMNGSTILSGSGFVGNNPGTDWKIVGTGDFNGDGKSDILWQNTNGQAAVWLMDGTTILSDSGYAGNNPGTDWKEIGTGDFNGDGKSDILWQNTNGQAAVWFMDGTTILSGSGYAGNNPGTDWKEIGTGDFNGDGKADILWQNTNGQAAIWLMDGTTILSGSGFVGNNPGTDWVIKGAADVNGDGKSDVLWQNTSGQSAVWLMSGTNVLSGSGFVGNNPGTAWHVIASTGG